MKEPNIRGFNDQSRSSASRPSDSISMNADFWTQAALGHIMIAGAVEVWKWISKEQIFDKPVSEILRTIVNSVGNALPLVDGFPPDQYYDFTLCMLAIGASESKYNDTAHETIDDVKGIFQLRPATADYMGQLYNKADSAIRKIIDETPMIETLASYAPNEAKLLKEKGADLKIDLENPTTQIPLTVAFFVRTAQMLVKDWCWDPIVSRWSCKSPALPSLMDDLENAVPGAMTDRLLGMQVITSAYHINGHGLLHARVPLTHLAYLTDTVNRYATDCATVTHLATTLDHTKMGDLFGLKLI